MKNILKVQKDVVSIITTIGCRLDSLQYVISEKLETEIGYFCCLFLHTTIDRVYLYVVYLQKVYDFVDTTLGTVKNIAMINIADDGVNICLNLIVTIIFCITFNCIYKKKNSV